MDKSNKNAFWKMVYLGCCAFLIICFFLPAFNISFGIFGDISMSFYDMTFGEMSDISNIVMLIFPLILTGLSFIRIKWKYLNILIYITASIAVLILLLFIGNFDEVTKPAPGYILSFVGYIGITASSDTIKNLEKKENKKSENDSSINVTEDHTGKVCVNCGKLLKENAKFCEKCGTPVNVYRADPKCPNCGAETKSNDRFCEKCGQKLKE